MDNNVIIPLITSSAVILAPITRMAFKSWLATRNADSAARDEELAAFRRELRRERELSALRQRVLEERMLRLRAEDRVTEMLRAGNRRRGIHTTDEMEILPEFLSSSESSQ